MEVVVMGAAPYHPGRCLDRIPVRRIVTFSHSMVLNVDAHFRARSRSITANG
jgi:hypothetical protein